MAMGIEAVCGIAEGASELLAEGESGAEQADFDVGLGEIEGLGGFAYGEALDIAQEKDQPVFVVEFVQGGVQQPA